MAKKLPKQYESIKKRFSAYFQAVDSLGKVVRKAGPIDKKTSQLIQLAAAAAVKSEGGVHSHVKRALEAGATPAEIYHAIILLTNTIGFPNVSAALSWVDDIISENN